MALDLILRNATIITPRGRIQGNIGIKEGKIIAVGDVKEKTVSERDCTGLFILPGAIDMHVHFRDPGFPEKEDFATGSAAAAAGGVTTVIDMPNTNPPTLTVQALEEKRAIAKAKSLVNFGFLFGFSPDNFEEIRTAQNIAGVKVYMGSTTGNLLVQDSNVIEKLFQLGKFVVVHAEDNAIIRSNIEKYKDNEDPAVHSLIHSPAAAYEAIKLVLHLAKKHNARVHITHLSTKMEVEELRKFKTNLVSADATPHHLFLTQTDYTERGNFVKMNPPLRTNKDRQAIWAGIRKGLISGVASDHAPHTKAEKEKPYSQAPAGVPGVETMLPLLFDAVNHGESNLEDVAVITSTNPALLLGIRGKGIVEVDYDADLVIVDMNLEMDVGSRKLFTKCGWSPFSSWKLKGWPVMTVVNGNIVFDDGNIVYRQKGREVQF